MKEEWRLVRVGWYSVSSRARVRREIGGVQGAVKGKILRQYPDRDGHRYVRLCINGIVGQVYVHQLVAGAFIGPCPKGKEVNHIDTIKWHNWPGNLEYLTRRENAIHAARNGLMAHPVLTLEKVKKIRKLYRSGFDKHEISSMCKVKVDTAYRVYSGRTWAWVE